MNEKRQKKIQRAKAQVERRIAAVERQRKLVQKAKRQLDKTASAGKSIHKVEATLENRAAKLVELRKSQTDGQAALYELEAASASSESSSLEPSASRDIGESSQAVLSDTRDTTSPVDHAPEPGKCSACGEPAGGPCDTLCRECFRVKMNDYEAKLPSEPKNEAALTEPENQKPAGSQIEAALTEPENQKPAGSQIEAALTDDDEFINKIPGGMVALELSVRMALEGKHTGIMELEGRYFVVMHTAFDQLQAFGSDWLIFSAPSFECLREDLRDAFRLVDGFEYDENTPYIPPLEGEFECPECRQTGARSPGYSCPGCGGLSNVEYLAQGFRGVERDTEWLNQAVSQPDTPTVTVRIDDSWKARALEAQAELASLQAESKLPSENQKPAGSQTEAALDDGDGVDLCLECKRPFPRKEAALSATRKEIEAALARSEWEDTPIMHRGVKYTLVQQDDMAKIHRANTWITPTAIAATVEAVEAALKLPLTSKEEAPEFIEHVSKMKPIDQDALLGAERGRQFREAKNRAEERAILMGFRPTTLEELTTKLPSASKNEAALTEESKLPSKAYVALTVNAADVLDNLPHPGWGDGLHRFDAKTGHCKFCHANSSQDGRLSPVVGADECRKHLNRKNYPLADCGNAPVEQAETWSDEDQIAVEEAALLEEQSASKHPPKLDTPCMDCKLPSVVAVGNSSGELHYCTDHARPGGPEEWRGWEVIRGEAPAHSGLEEALRRAKWGYVNEEDGAWFAFRPDGEMIPAPMKTEHAALILLGNPPASRYPKGEKS